MRFQKLELGPRFQRKLNRKSPEMTAAIARCIDKLFNDPRHSSLHTRKVRGKPERIWEAWIDDANRVTFEMLGDNSEILYMRNHCNLNIIRRRQF